jgi:hypothetical protein
VIMKKQVRLQSEQKQSTEQQEHQQQAAGTALEFDSAESLLRHDALHTPIPPRVEERLRESLAEETLPGRPWWKKLLGG